MKFLNLDVHISVAEDLAHIFETLGHEFARNSLSGHNWVNGAPEPRTKGVTRSNWRTIGPKLVEKFYRKNKNRFSDIDAFVVSYPPAFALLFEPFEKPVISVTCTRFDYPTFPQNYDWLVEGMRRMHARGQLFSVANNLLDKWYNDNILGVPTLHISSLCGYLSQSERLSRPTRKFVTWTRHPHTLTHDLIDPGFTISRRYDRGVVGSYSGVVHVPYNLSIMSAFEHYWQCIPMYFPTAKLQREWVEDPLVGGLQEVLFSSTALEFSSDLVGLADWYDSANFAGVRLFDSEKELHSMIETDDLAKISDEMFSHNVVRQREIYSRWEQVIALL